MSSQLDATVAHKLNITVKQNQTFNPKFTFTDRNGNSINMTGAAAKLSVRQTECGTTCGCDGESDFDTVYSQDFTGQITGINHNQIAFNDIIKLSPGLYKYDLIVDFIDGVEQQFYFLTGAFRVKKSYANV
jgi:hypothetical protein